MRSRFALVAALSLFALPLAAKDIYIVIGGSVGAFRSDVRIFNPSTTNDIVIQARYLPAGSDTSHPDNSLVAGKSITIPKRQMVVYDDVVSSLFSAGGLGAIRLTSDDDFVATQRVYAGVSNSASSTPCAANVNPCTLGQFVPGAELGNAQRKGVMIQLKSNNAFRTNFGVVNPNGAAANITFTVYDKANNAAGTKTMTLKPFGVITPTSITSFANAGADLSDAWVSYVSDQPVFAYSSVVDNGSTDQTFIAAAEDSGSQTQSTPPPAQPNTFDVTLHTSRIDISPSTTTIKVGDKVTVRVTAADPGHGFTLIAPDLTVLVPDAGARAVGQTITYTFTAVEGTYNYYCTQTTCSSGHLQMAGTFDVGQPSRTCTGYGCY